MNRSIASWLKAVPDNPFYLPRKPPWRPQEMAGAPNFPVHEPTSIERRYALLLNPFYPGIHTPASASMS
jgi:hypothetical protein